MMTNGHVTTSTHRNGIGPVHGTLESISDSPMAYRPQTYHILGYPANSRMFFARLYLQLGMFVDYYTGQHDP
jgi:hypothetical protein